ncbi:MAG: hypothetical protein HW384_1822, partial [Dehalococcoidia bacterium]|nr:hypothetical protein [Dehalococcoidia bacterium]
MTRSRNIGLILILVLTALLAWAVITPRIDLPMP